MPCDASRDLSSFAAWPVSCANCDLTSHAKGAMSRGCAMLFTATSNYSLYLLFSYFSFNNSSSRIYQVFFGQFKLFSVPFGSFYPILFGSFYPILFSLFRLFLSNSFGLFSVLFGSFRYFSVISRTCYLESCYSIECNITNIHFYMDFSCNSILSWGILPVYNSLYSFVVFLAWNRLYRY